MSIQRSRFNIVSSNIGIYYDESYKNVKNKYDRERNYNLNSQPEHHITTRNEPIRTEPIRPTYENPSYNRDYSRSLDLEYQRKQADYTQYVVNNFYDPKLYHLSKENFTLKSDLDYLEREIKSSTEIHNAAITRAKENLAFDQTTTMDKMDSTIKHLEQEYEKLQDRKSDALLSVKKEESDMYTDKNLGEDEISTLKLKIEEISIEVLKMKGSLQNAIREETNLINEVKLDLMNNDEYERTILQSYNREKEEMLEKVKIQKDANYRILEDKRITRESLGRDLYRLSEDVTSGNLALNNADLEKANNKTEYESMMKEMQNFKTKNEDLKKEKQIQVDLIDKNKLERLKLMKELGRLDSLVYGEHATQYKMKWGLTFDPNDTYQLNTLVNKSYTDSKQMSSPQNNSKKSLTKITSPGVSTVPKKKNLITQEKFVNRIMSKGLRSAYKTGNGSSRNQLSHSFSKY